MQTYASLIAYALVASLLAALIYAARSTRLQNRFRRLDPLPGRRMDEILKFAGKPSHRVRMAADRELLEWRRAGFHIALMFTHDICDGVEYVQKPGSD